MLTNPEVVTETAARVLQNIQNSCDDGDLAEVADIIVIVAVHYGAIDDGSADMSSTFYGSSTGMIHRQLGLIEEGRRSIERSVRPRDGE